MPMFSDAQLVLLSAASQRDDRLLPLNRRLRGIAAERCTTPLVRDGYIVMHDVRADHPEAWFARDRRYYIFRITLRGLGALGIEPEIRDLDPNGLFSDPAELIAFYEEEGRALQRCLLEWAPGNALEKPRGVANPPTGDSPATRGKAVVLALLRSEDGTSIADIAAATGWQPHSVRAALSRLRKAGCDIEALREAGQIARYRLNMGPEA